LGCFSVIAGVLLVLTAALRCWIFDCDSVGELSLFHVFSCCYPYFIGSWVIIASSSFGNRGLPGGLGCFSVIALVLLVLIADLGCWVFDYDSAGNDHYFTGLLVVTRGLGC
jgi:hypothetical protein